MFDPKTSRLTDFVSHCCGRTDTCAGNYFGRPVGAALDRLQNDIWRIQANREALERCRAVDIEKQQQLNKITTLSKTGMD
ncbi:MAG: hypothetical protein H6559_32125 [Lewinellaceae bacterium]|nr:hypothetical protein [Lewinellaceae bacterium]